MASSCRGPVASLGAVIEPSGDDFTQIVRQRIEEQAHHGRDITLEFAPGTYHFYPERAHGRYIAVSNNDNGYKRIVFDLEGVSGVSIKGHDSQFIFHGREVPFCFRNCRDVELSGISIDYEDPFVFEGTVIGSDRSQGSFTLRVHPDNHYEIRDGRLLFTGYDWSSPLGENIVFDPETHRPLYHTSLYEHGYGVRELRAEELSEGVVRLSGMVSADVPPVGSVYTDKGRHGEDRRYPGIIIQDCEGVSISDVTVYRSGAMALIAERSSDITMEDYNVCLHEGSDRMISASADATHFVGCRGNIEFRGCRFESMLDDATNIHSIYMKVDTLVGPGTVGASFGHFQLEGYEFGAQGDSVAIVDRSTLGVLSRGVIRSINRVNENYYEISSSAQVDDFEPDRLAIVNLSDYASVHMDSCSVRYNRARSLLLSTAGPILIENSYFSSMMAGIRICGDANYWFESGPVSQVVIRGNTFEDIGIGGHSPQAILQVDPVIPPQSRDRGYYHGSIVFEDNVVKTFDSQAIYALSVDSLTIRGNKFIDSDTHSALYPDLSVIDAQYCRSLSIEDNDFSAWSPDATISIKECPSPEIKGEGVPEIVVNPNRFFYQN